MKETADKWGINPRTVQTIYNDGRIHDEKFGKAWAISSDDEKSSDKRIISGKYKKWRVEYKKWTPNDIL